MMATSIFIAIQAIRRHVLRSLLTVLGIVIGVWSVVTMVTLGNATSTAVTSSITALGSNSLTLMPGQGMGRGGGGSTGAPFRFADVEAIANEVSGVDRVVPQVSTNATVVLDAANWQTTITGTADDYLDIQQWKLNSGRRFTPQEESGGRAVCLLGDTVREKLIPTGTAEGRNLRVGSISCEIIGTLSARGQGFGNNPDDSVIMPIKAVQRRLTGDRDVSSILMSYDPRFDATAVKEQLTQVMRERRLIGPNEDDDFNIFDARQIADTLETTTTLLTALLAAVGAVSLVVGGIGIMNIMLVSVTERTREIGIRLAVGAVARDVLLQFLIEAVVLSAIGGLIGVVLANATTLIVAPLIGVSFAFNAPINVLAFVLSGAIGVIFGYVPARRAASLNPIDALRHE